MSNNHEEKHSNPSVHLLIALQRGVEKKRCMRMVIRNYDTDIAIMRLRCRIAGGTWRIHHTVNARDCAKARSWLIHKMIDTPDCGAYMDTLWKTALLQPGHVYGEKLFMLDVDTNDEDVIRQVLWILRDKIALRRKSPKGWHFLCSKFDTRIIAGIENVSVIRDGYYFVEEVKP